MLCHQFVLRNFKKNRHQSKTQYHVYYGDVGYGHRFWRYMAWFLILALLLPIHVTKPQLHCKKKGMDLHQSIILRITCDNVCRGLSDMPSMLEVLNIAHFYCRTLFALSQITPLGKP